MTTDHDKVAVAHLSPCSSLGGSQSWKLRKNMGQHIPTSLYKIWSLAHWNANHGVLSHISGVILVEIDASEQSRPEIYYVDPYRVTAATFAIHGAILFGRLKWYLMTTTLIFSSRSLLRFSWQKAMTVPYASTTRRAYEKSRRKPELLYTNRRTHPKGTELRRCSERPLLKLYFQLVKNAL